MQVLQPSIPAGRIKLSIDEYLELPNDGKRYQIIDGELDVTPSPNLRHQRISRRLQGHLIAQLEQTGLGEIFNAPIDVMLDRTSIVQPDLVFVSNARKAILGTARIEGAPDLVVEIISPSSRRMDIITKSELYARFGVSHYWIADPDIDRLEVYRLRAGEYELITSAQAPTELIVAEPAAMTLPLAEIFA